MCSSALLTGAVIGNKSTRSEQKITVYVMHLDELQRIRHRLLKISCSSDKVPRFSFLPPTTAELHGTKLSAISGLLR